MNDGGGAPPEKVDISAIGTAPPEPVPNDLARQDQDKRRDPFTGRPDPNLDRHLGSLGKFFGGGPEKAGNIAGLVVIIATVLLFSAVISLAVIDTVAVADVMKVIIASAFSLITGALGFIFGASSKKAD